MTQRVAATAIVVWLWAGMFAETLQVGSFVKGLIFAADALNVDDATLRIEGAPADTVNTRVLVDVESWNETAHRSVGTDRKTVGESAF